MTYKDTVQANNAHLVFNLMQQDIILPDVWVNEDGSMALRGQVTTTTEKTFDAYFSIITSETIELNTDITDHLIENNTYVQDHIALKPVTYKLQGLVGEKVYSAPAEVPVTYPTDIRDLFALSALSPTLSTYAYGIYDTAKILYDKGKQLKDGANYLQSFFKKKPSYKKALKGTVDNTRVNFQNPSHQREILTLMDYFRVNRIPVKLITGYDMPLTNMYIESVSMTQGATHQQSDLTVTVKEIRTVSPQYRAFSKADYNRYANQMQQEQNLGQMGGKPTSILEQGYLNLKKWANTPTNQGGA